MLAADRTFLPMNVRVYLILDQRTARSELSTPRTTDRAHVGVPLVAIFIGSRRIRVNQRRMPHAIGAIVLRSTNDSHAEILADDPLCGQGNTAERVL